MESEHLAARDGAPDAAPDEVEGARGAEAAGEVPGAGWWVRERVEGGAEEEDEAEEKEVAYGSLRYDHHGAQDTQRAQPRVAFVASALLPNSPLSLLEDREARRDHRC